MHITLEETKQGSIADYFALASAWKFAEGRGATTSQVLEHLASSATFQAEASAK